MQDRNLEKGGTISERGRWRRKTSRVRRWRNTVEEEITLSIMRLLFCAAGQFASIPASPDWIVQSMGETEDPIHTDVPATRGQEQAVH